MPTSTTLSRSHTGIHQRPDAIGDPAPTVHDVSLSRAPAPRPYAAAESVADPSGYLAQLFGGVAPRARADSQGDLLRELIDGLTDARRPRQARGSAPREITAREAPTREITAREIAAREIAAREIAAREIAAREIAAREIAAREIAAREIAAREIAAREIAAREIAAREPRAADHVDACIIDASTVDASTVDVSAAEVSTADAGAAHATRAAHAPEPRGLRAWLAPLLPGAPMRCFFARASLLALTLGTAALSAACREAADPNVIRMNGTLEAPIVDLAPKVTGRVTEVLVREGDRVKAGDLLIKFDIGETAIAVDRDRAAVASAQARAKDLEAGSRQREIAAARSEVADRAAAVALAKKELERQQYLLSRKVGTERDLDRARTDLERTEATLKISRDKLQLTEEGTRVWQKEQARTDVTRAEAQLRQSETVAAEAELRAPANAIVTHRIAEPGLLVGAGQAAITLSYTDRLYVRTFIPEPQLGRIKQGAVAEVTVDAFPGRTFAARVSEISPRAEFTPKAVETREERVNLVYASKVDLNNGWNEPLVPGQPAEVVVRVQGGGSSTGSSSGAAATQSSPSQPQPAAPAQPAPAASSTPSTSSAPAAPAARPQE